jgi:outer membrane protein OmpA-like peptidoglycan-associated protein
VSQLLKQQTFVKFNTAAFFESGGYEIPSEKNEDAKSAFSPIIDSLFAFIKKYPKYKLEASVIINGYADGQGFGETDLLNQLTKNIGKNQATKEELNQELSRLRSEGVSQIIVGIYNDKLKEIPSDYEFNTRFIKIGKGEEYPNKKIDNYQIDDERRRIVVIYWNAVPKD